MRDSIHFRRRWYYVLWSCLLAGSICAWILWETPARSGLADIQVRVVLRGGPESCRLITWSGSRQQWRGVVTIGNLGTAGQSIPIGGSVTATLKIPVAYRRWTGDFIPRRTSDLAVLVFEPPTGAPRYLALPLDRDLRRGLLGLNHKLWIGVEYSWADLSTDPLQLPEANEG